MSQIQDSESVIQDIQASNTASGTVSLTATRYIYEFTNVAGTWTLTGTRTLVPNLGLR